MGFVKPKMEYVENNPAFGHSKGVRLTSLYQENMEQAYARQHSSRGKRMDRIRAGTVEPVFGNQINYYGLRKINVKGKTGAHKVMLMSAAAYNIRKLIRHTDRKRHSNLQVLTRELCAFAKTIYSDCIRSLIAKPEIPVTN